MVARSDRAGGRGGKPAPGAPGTGLRYVVDSKPGIRRLRMAGGFRYVNSRGQRIRDVRVLKRIQSLAVPPAWTEVWICGDPRGHLQATGRDARGRKQYRYHTRWRETRDENKFGRMLAFGRALPGIRRRVRRDLRQPGLGRQKVLALVVRLLDLTAARVGNEEYAVANHSYGLTTLRDRHAHVQRNRLRLKFRGKGGKEHLLDCEHPRLARIVKRCRDLPGMRLFQYVDEEGTVRTITSSDVNEYLAEVGKGEFTAKDFRTWTGSVVAAQSLSGCEEVNSARQKQRNVLNAIRDVAARLGNTPTVCRKCYVHPAVIDAYGEGTLQESWQRAGQSARSSSALRPEETAILHVLRRRTRETPERRLARLLRKSLGVVRGEPRVL